MTTRNRLGDDHGRAVTSGETEDGRRDGNPVWGGLAAQTTSSVRKNPKQATDTNKEKYPQG